MVDTSKKSTIIPKKLQPILWSVDVGKLDMKKDKAYIIHQILTYGTFEDLKWLFSTYGKKTVVDVFLNQPVKQYPAIVYKFVKNFLLGLRKISLDEQIYITSISGPLRQRTAETIR